MLVLCRYSRSLVSHAILYDDKKEGTYIESEEKLMEETQKTISQFNFKFNILFIE